MFPLLHLFANIFIATLFCLFIGGIEKKSKIYHVPTSTPLLTHLQMFSSSPFQSFLRMNWYIIVENATSDAMNIIEEHKEQIRKNKLMSICIIVGKA